MVCQIGQWVQVHKVILKPGERAPQVPAETQKVPLEMWCKGFAQNQAELGEQVTVKTVIGQAVTGTLTEIEPGYKHDFGVPAPELLTIGMELRNMLAGGEMPCRK